MSQNHLQHVTADYLLNELFDLGIQGTLKKYRQSTVPSRVLQELYDTAPPSLIHPFLAAYSNTPSALLNELATISENVNVLIHLVRHPRTPREALMQLADHEDPAIREELAANKNLTPQLAMKLAADPHPLVRTVLAENSNLIDRLQLSLSRDESTLVRTALAARRGPSTELVEQLLLDESFAVTATLTATGDLADEQLLKLADSDRYQDQALLLQNDKLPDRVLESLSFSSHPDIALEAIRRKTLNADELIGWAGHADEAIRQTVAAKPNLPVEIQLMAARDTLAVQLALAAGSPCEEALEIFLNEGSEAVHQILACNAQISLDFIHRFCESCSVVCLKIIAQRDDLNDDILDLMINRRAHHEVIYHLATYECAFSAISEELTAQLTRHRLPTLRAFAANSENLTIEQMERLAEDPAPMVRRQLARQPKAPLPLLEFLADDTDPETADLAFAQWQFLLKQQQEQPLVNENPATAPESEAGSSLLSKFFKKLKRN